MPRVTTAEAESLLGEQLRRLRIDSGITQEELADRSDLSVKSVRALETGEGSRLSTLIRVLRVLDREDWLDDLHPEPEVSPMRLLRESRGERPRRRVRRSEAR
ncbi:helix-turn-helix domain-containing protein [Pseudolysinimonas sp.]|uniref:helix-turn-helix transcriptional regulator n=1 Tax=Pseudolysinimonas sp. TaxID=2680009 RepID=UPI00286B3DAE|nr:helix-turn-helix domain-containing protein [Pseudolysinimonas sp.]